MTQPIKSMELKLPTEQDMKKNEPESLAEATTKALSEGEPDDMVVDKLDNQEANYDNQSVDKNCLRPSKYSSGSTIGTGIGEIPAGDTEKNDKPNNRDGI